MYIYLKSCFNNFFLQMASRVKIEKGITWVENENPWNIKSIYELQYFNCPSCEFRDCSKQTFVNHAFKDHPEAVDFLTNLQDDSLSDVVIDIPANITYVKSEANVTEPIVEIETVEKENDNESEETTAFQCFSCGKTYSSVTEVKQHIKDNHKLEIENDNNEVNQEIYEEEEWDSDHSDDSALDKAFQCKRCGKGYSSVSELKQHIEINHKGSYGSG